MKLLAHLSLISFIAIVAYAWTTRPDIQTLDNVQITSLTGSNIHVDPKELDCLAQNIYFEAGGEGMMDKIYVANVTKNRVQDSRWPSTFCKVIKQPYQFSWYPHKKKEHWINRNQIERDMWEDSVNVAYDTIAGLISDYTKGATFYHAKWMKKYPKWANQYQQIASVDSKEHAFYK